MLRRRDVLAGLGVAGFAAAGGSGLLARQAAPSLKPRPPVSGGRLHEWTLTARERPARLLGSSGPNTPVWTYSDGLLPVMRVHLGDRIRATLHNELPQHTSIHWHGIRLDNPMDGVPYLTQPPVMPGESFTYELMPPDPGTFFIHPHCNESGQTGRGMASVLIVEGDEARRPDDDIVLAYKDWRLAPDGAWLPTETAEGASRAGTFGTVRAVNGIGAASRDVRPNGDLRLRILNLDNTRIIEVGVEDADAFVIAVDGNAVAPFTLDTWRMGPAMRLDLLVRAPAAGRSFKVIDYFGAETWTLGTFMARGDAKKRTPFDPALLYAPDIPRVDIARAERLSFSFSAASGSIAETAALLAPDDPLAKILMDALCVRDSAFWAINKTSWPSGDHRNIPPPIGMLEAGKSYVFELSNVTPHPHPIHLHGHTFEVLSASRLKRPRHFADTLLLQPKERIEIAFVARPGDWMFHCHVLEHLEYGMMGYLRVA
ncbi:multicopper oxidase family protein [Microvirga pudoricolor]|uniref:multicopper oxidase family protein n=1 Tax=Microvirga pudoricolor TaxID=2778729 RepID=UPI0019503A34|nr:multicopper oxidase family protein [Microvirga pudoricolor]MBM6593335.1 multicopper oxidase family protein [Microvirga pudoricolor]